MHEGFTTHLGSVRERVGPETLVRGDAKAEPHFLGLVGAEPAPAEKGVSGVLGVPDAPRGEVR